MRRLCLILAVMLGVLPLQVFAHASPVETQPASSAALQEAPQEVVIRFSERPEEGASRVQVFDAANKEISGTTVSKDSHTIAANLSSLPVGTYTVKWSVVSQDDGHFTRGSFSFSVGTGIAPDIAAQSEVIKSAGTLEVSGMFAELLGNSLAWGALLAALLLRRLTLANSSRAERLIGTCALIGAALIAGGAIFQFVLKSAELAGVQSISFMAAADSFASTASGAALIIRACVGMCIVAVEVVRRIVRYAYIYAAYITVALLCVFAYFRAVISHATANPFFPELSVAVNFIHLIEKDGWAGIALVGVLLMVSAAFREHLPEILSRISKAATVFLGGLSVSGAYIVWLHLESFQNLRFTDWGNTFIALFAAACLLVAARTASVMLHVRKPRIYARFAIALLIFEAAAGISVVYFSSVQIITSPPPHEPPAARVQALHSDGRINVEPYAPEKDSLLITAPASSTLVVFAGTLEDGIALEAHKRFEGGYVVPAAPALQEGTLSVAASQPGAYDARGAFSVTRVSNIRTFDAFTLFMILFGAAGALWALVLWRLESSRPPLEHVGRMKRGQASLVFAAAMFICIELPFVASIALGNPFKAQCESDGNMWHLMQPMKAGVPTTGESMEGCMWGMGTYTYMFPDRREYEYYQSFPKADVSIDRTSFVAGVPSHFTVTLKEENGAPAELFMDMEKRVHTVIVSKDQSVFAHIHPDESEPRYERAVETSTFNLLYTFPKSGEYLISVDYAHGLTLESKQFTVMVAGTPKQSAQETMYASPATFGGYDVSLKYFQPFAGEVMTLTYTIAKDGAPVTNIEPYLSAAMHISAVKNDLSAFIHTHGEVHLPGTPYPPIIVKNGQVVHSMASMVLPPTFGPTVETHLIFPTTGLYTVWGEFKVGSTIIPTSFTVRVE